MMTMVGAFAPYMAVQAPDACSSCVNMHKNNINAWGSNDHNYSYGDRGEYIILGADHYFYSVDHCTDRGDLPYHTII